MKLWKKKKIWVGHTLNMVYDQGTVKVEKKDDYTVSFTFPLKQPTAMEMLSQIFIMPEHIYKDVTDFDIMIIT